MSGIVADGAAMARLANKGLVRQQWAMADAVQTGRNPQFRRRAAARPDAVPDAALAWFGAQVLALASVAQVARRTGLEPEGVA